MYISGLLCVKLEILINIFVISHCNKQIRRTYDSVKRFHCIQFINVTFITNINGLVTKNKKKFKHSFIKKKLAL